MFPGDLAAYVVGDGFRHRLRTVLDALRQGPHRRGQPALQDQVQQPDVAEVRDRLGRLRLDIGVDQVAHVGLVGLEIDDLAAGVPDDVAQLYCPVDLLLDCSFLGR